jgi:HD-like signal output (HDOD) protein
MFVAMSDQQKRWKEAVLKLDRLPALSPTAVRLLGRLAVRDCEMLDIVKLIEQDALLSGQILGAANSAAFYRLQPISSVRHAVMMLGLEHVRKFALIKSISNMFGKRKLPPSFSIKQFNLHSVATGMLVELLTESAPIADKDSAFLAGLFHDIGKLAIALALPELYEDLLKSASVTGEPIFEGERALLGIDHAELSALAVRHWGLGEPVRSAAAWHHEPDQAPAVPGMISLAMAVSKADAWVNDAGICLLAQKPTTEEIRPLAFGGFTVDYQSVIEPFTSNWTTVGAMF